MPVYNEHDTVGDAIKRVLRAEIPDTVLELVIVESNSTDGSRDIVSRHAQDPRVVALFEDAPRGKGHAVRTGLAHATGQIILIQDADLEYAVEDYPVLLAPILRGETDFTLGSRHVRGVPMRSMPEQRFVGWLVNTAHWAFTGVFDAAYGVRLRDPFTMYKVFRSECVADVEFVSNRFDFDWELVAKLIRLGYRPVEVPVSYTARSFGEGKKVRFFRDPPSWVLACIRFRFSRLKPRTAEYETIDARVVEPSQRPLPQVEEAVGE